MRRKLIAGNWKMNLTAIDARAMIAELRKLIDPDAALLAKDRDLLIAPSSVIDSRGRAGARRLIDRTRRAEYALGR